jgi:ABC-type polysaccharide/polyol phosphate export permease
MQPVIHFLKDFIKNQHMIIVLAKNDFKKKYLGSYLGILWAFIQPTINILLFWFVFQVGFKSTPVENVPFILWLSTAMIPWNFFSESLQSAANSILENGFLVKKVVFRVSILPIVKIYSSLYVHLFFILLLVVMFLIYGYMPSIYYLQLPYYLCSMFLLILGISWATSALAVFLRDVGQIIAMTIQFGFWLTPIFYSLDIIPERFRIIFKLNPVYYITEGYRDTFIHHKWFWQHTHLTLSFWLLTCGILLIGAFIFKKLRPHLADVL